MLHPRVFPISKGAGSTIDRPMEPTDLAPDAPADAPDPVEPTAVPPVVAVMVTRDPGPWLEESLAALGESDYPALAVLVIDAGSAEDPTPRVASVLPSAFVRRVEGDVGFAVAANEARGSVTGATFLLLCHDDAAVAPDAIRLLVEEAYRSNAAVVGPKVVDHDRPDLLLEVGLSIDRFAVPHAGVESGELDQEQHDAVRDVFYVSDTAMLVRADLFGELEGFDPATFPGGEDLDLCWRARLAGARVMVAPDARVRHRRVARGTDTGHGTGTGVEQRHRVRALLKAYSGWSLLYLVPAALVLAVAEALVLLLTGRRGRARTVLGGWAWNVRHLSDVRAARRRAQAMRTVPDSELRGLQVRGSARVRSYVVGSLRAEDRIRALSERSRSMADTASAGVRTPQVALVLVFVAVAIIAVRGLYFGGIPGIGQLATWPGASSMAETFTSQWRTSGLGSVSAAPTALAGYAAAGFVLIGQTGLARTLIVLLALPVGMIGTARLARRISGSGRWATIGATLVYGVNPVLRNAVAEGRFGALVLYALAPFVLSSLLRVAGYLSDDEPRRRWRSIVGVAALVAVTSAIWPPAILLPVVFAVALALAAPLARDPARRVGSLVGIALAGTAAAIVLLLPWPLAYLQAGDRASALGFAFVPTSGLGPVLRFATGPNGDTVLGWAFLIAALLALLVAAGPRLAWVIRVWMIALVSFALAWVPGRWFPDGAVPAVEGVLAPAALGLALAVGIGIAAFTRDVRARHFGWRQLAAGIGALALVAAGLGFVGDAPGGRWHAPDRGWSDALSFMQGDVNAGGFRVLWIGEPGVLPVDPLRRSGVAYGVTDGGPGDVRASLPPPPGGASARVGRAVDLLAHDRSDRVGRVLAPMSVRYVVVPDRPGPGSGSRAPVPATLVDSLADQVDFVRLDVGAGVRVYENRAWIPHQAVVTGRRVPATAPSPLEPPVPPAAVVPLAEGRPAPAGTVLWGEAYHDGWQASADGRDLAHRRAFGWSNAYALPHRAEVSFAFTDQWMRYPWILLEVVLIAGAIVLRRGTVRVRRERRGERGVGHGDG